MNDHEKRIHFLKAVVYRYENPTNHQTADAAFCHRVRRQLHHAPDDGRYTIGGAKQVIYGTASFVRCLGSAEHDRYYNNRIVTEQHPYPGNCYLEAAPTRITSSLSASEIYLSSMRAAKLHSPAKIKKLVRPGDRVDVCYGADHWDHTDETTRLHVGLHRNCLVNSNYTVEVDDVVRSEGDGVQVWDVTKQFKTNYSGWIQHTHVLWWRKSDAPPGLFLPPPTFTDNTRLELQSHGTSIFYRALEKRSADLIGVMLNTPEFANKKQKLEQTPGTVENNAMTLYLSKQVLFPCPPNTTFTCRGFRMKQRVDIIRLMLGQLPSQPNWPHVLPACEWGVVMKDVILHFESDSVKYLAENGPEFDASEKREFLEIACAGPNPQSIASTRHAGIPTFVWDRIVDQIIPYLFERYGDVYRETISDVWLLRVLMRLTRSGSELMYADQNRIAMRLADCLDKDRVLTIYKSTLSKERADSLFK